VPPRGNRVPSVASGVAQATKKLTLSAGFLLMVCGTGLKVIRLMLPVLGTGILFLHAASAESDAGRTLVEMRAVELPVDRQPVTGPTSG
jgi:hypothetical protein